MLLQLLSHRVDQVLVFQQFLHLLVQFFKDLVELLGDLILLNFQVLGSL